jgi:LPXTG-motif cell wall-anchored protein
MRPPQEQDRSMWWWLLIGVALAIAVAGYYFWKKNQAPATPPAQVVQPAPVAPPAAEDRIEHPVEAPPAAPLPQLADSDRALQDELGALVADKALRDLFFVDRIVRRFVATIDNLPRSKVSPKVMPVKPVADAFLVDVAGDERTISAENDARYARYVALVEAIDTTKAVAVYVRLYPLFQQAYQELGYPKRNFNDRLVQVIDHLLLTPELQGPIRVLQPKVLYEFADPQLESRSAGQKILLRMGTENARRVKAKLRELRAQIADGVLGRK